VIFQGRRYRLISQSAQSVWVAPRGTRQRPIVVARTNPDLIMEPTADDLELAEGFERGDIGVRVRRRTHVPAASRDLYDGQETQIQSPHSLIACCGGSSPSPFAGVGQGARTHRQRSTASPVSALSRACELNRPSQELGVRATAADDALPASSETCRMAAATRSGRSSCTKCEASLRISTSCRLRYRCHLTLS
jgi:hypothetical protein